MIPKKNRLNSFFFKNFLRKGSVIDTPLFSLRLIQHKNDDFRVTVTVSKKVARKATERNLLKRRFLSVVAQTAQHLKKDTSYIFLLKKEAALADFKTIKSLVVDTINKQN